MMVSADDDDDVGNTMARLHHAINGKQCRTRLHWVEWRQKLERALQNETK